MYSSAEGLHLWCFISKGLQNLVSLLRLVYLSNVRPILKKSKESSSHVVCDASTQSKDTSHSMTRTRGRFVNHDEDWSVSTVKGKDLVAMGKGQLLQTIKNIVETPYYRLDSVIYKLRKELEHVKYSQDDKSVSTSTDLENVNTILRYLFLHDDIYTQKL